MPKAAHKRNPGKPSTRSKVNKSQARDAAYDKLINLGLDWAEFEIQDDAPVNRSENGGRWVQSWIYVTREELVNA